MRYELRNRKEVAAADEMERDLAAARSYVESLLPARLATGPVRTDWLFEPSARIGGDALGYHAIDEHHFAVGWSRRSRSWRGRRVAASVINVMRKQRAAGVHTCDQRVFAAERDVSRCRMRRHIHRLVWRLSETQTTAALLS
jgi:sigma-B regulation protein RsbU (phosphoserine phosphatase)